MNQDLQAIFHSKINAVLSWLAAISGLGAFAGLFSTTVAILSGIWLCVQLYGWFRFTLPLKKVELAEARKKFGTDVR